MINIMKECLPPVAARFLSHILGRKTFKGNYASWNAAMNASTGYDSDRIVNKVKESAMKVRDGDAVYERDSVLFDEIQYSWPLLAGILWIASRSGNRLSLVDFGGALGSSYYQNRGFLAHLEYLRWSIVEQEKFFRIGKEQFQNEHVRFYKNLPDCISEEKPSLLLLCAVLQYLENPNRFLEEVLDMGFDYIILDRTSFIKGQRDLLCVQRVDESIYRASYPCWFFGNGRFLAHLNSRYQAVAGFECAENANLKNTFFKGYIFRKRS